MNYWVSILLLTLLIPLIMVICGKVFQKLPPKKINAVYGYRTAMSMKNRETWKFAHNYCGKIWLKTGIILLPISIAAMLCVIGKNEDAISVAGLIVTMADMTALVVSIFSVEAALKKTFDSDGRRREACN